MAYDIGPKIGIEGEAEFRKELRNVSENIKTLGTRMSVVTSEFGENKDSAEALSAQNEILAEKAELLKQKIEMQRDALKKAAARFGEASTEAQKWEQALNNSVTELNDLKTQLGKNERAMDGVDKSMEDVSSESKTMGDRIGALDIAFGNLVSNGIQAMVDGLKGAVDSFLGLDEATKSFRDEQAKLNTAFEAAGHSPEVAQKAYEGLYGVLGDSGEATEAAQLLASLAESTEQVTDWTEIAAGVAGTFGDALPISGLVEAANETAKVGEVTGALADALNWVGISEKDFNESLSALSTEEEKAAYITDTLKNAYSDAANSFRENNDSVIQANENQLILDETMSKLGGSISTLKNGMMSELLPGISNVGTAFSDMILDVEGSDQAFSDAVGGFISVASEKIPEFIEYGSSIISSLLKGIGDNASTIADGAVGIINCLVDEFVELLPEIVDVAGELIGSLVDGLLEGLPDILQSGFDMLMELVDGIIEAIPDMLERLPEIITEFVLFLTNNFPKIVESGMKILSALVEGLIKAIPELVKNLPKIVKAIVEGFTKAISSVTEIGKNVVQGVWNGIQQMGTWIKNKVKNFFGGIVDSVKGLLGIHSPSRVFAGIGENMAAGIGVGFGDEFGSIQRQVNRSMNDLIPDVSGNVSIGSSATDGAMFGFDGASFAAIVGAEVRKALNGVVVQMDGNRVGSLVTVHQRYNARAMGTA